MENLLYLVPIVFFAGLVRGYSGFGFAVIAVIGLNVFLPPIQSVPIVLGLDLLCSAGLLRQALKQANLSVLKRLVVGAAMGTPIGLALLLMLPSYWLKLLICLFVLGLIGVLLSKSPKQTKDSSWRQMVTGAASGAGTTCASVGGPMVLFYMLSSPLSVVTQRATMVLFFVLSDVLALIGLGASLLQTGVLVNAIAWLLLPTLVGVKIGQYCFNKRAPRSFKTLSLPLMAVTAVVGIIDVIGDFAGGS
ncbi:sulfite exporter TauE/SafE family protein [Rhodanobacter aciditrophus]|uniref:Probable membrane transporter protein n=1 Tax=Rhodanobacter aciditrophus TaxID=1623218 RepID=A0ABW4AYW4_9GAMM